MDLTATIFLRRNRELRDFVLFGTLAVIWLACDIVLFGLFGNPSFRLATTYALPLVALAGLILLARLNRRARHHGRTGVAAVGLLFVVGAAMTDLTSTVVVNPDLSLEANPYVRVLLDSGHSLRFVYSHMAVTQAAYIAMFCGLWITFLRHLPVLVQSIADARPGSWLEFLKAATGGSHLTTRQWLIPLRTSELPLLFHCLWPLVVSIVFGISLFRWYVALEWMDVVEPTLGARIFVVALGLTVTLMFYFHALRRLYERVLPLEPAHATTLE